MKNSIEKISKLFFLIGVVLIIVNSYGIFCPLGNESIYNEEKVAFLNDIDKRANNSLKSLLQEKNIKNKKDYVKKLVFAINKNIAHYWRDEGRIKYNLTIPFYENYLLWLAQYLRPEIYKKYEFCNYKKAIERKVGLCSQHAIILCGILNEKSIPCKIVGLSGHVVAMAKVNERENWILDADYGVIIPFSIKKIEKNPAIIVPFYERKLTYSRFSKKASNNPISLDRMVKI